MKQVFRRPSPAMVIAMVALLAALGGTAIGAKVLNKKKVKKIANNQITKRAPGLSVASAKSADTANKATNAENATNGAAFAYAAVDADGTLTSDYGVKNVSEREISRPAVGVYCFELSFMPKTGAANPQTQVGEDGILSLDLVSPYPGCPANAEAEVRNVDASTGAEQNDSFIVQFDN